MNNDKLQKGSVLVLKKGHPCGENLWEIIRFGAVCKLKCLGCQREVLMNRIDLRKKVKKVVNNEKVN